MRDKRGGEGRCGPILGLVLDELVHQVLALLVLEHDDFDAPLPEIVFSANKGLVLACWRSMAKPPRSTSKETYQ